jgi:hypothetical protein
MSGFGLGQVEYVDDGDDDGIDLTYDNPDFDWTPNEGDLEEGTSVPPPPDDNAQDEITETAPGTNLVTTPSFETAGTWEGTGWEVPYAWDYAYHGSNVARLNATGSGAPLTNGQDITVDPFQTFWVSGYGWMERYTTGSVRLMLDEKDAYGAILNTHVIGEWNDPTSWYSTISNLPPTSWYRCGESSGAYVDEMAAVNGTAVGTHVRNVMGAIVADTDGATRLPGATGTYIDLGDNFDFTGNAAFSVAGWVKSEDFTGSMHVIGKESTSTPDSGWYVSVEGGTYAKFVRYNADDSFTEYELRNTPEDSFQTGQWYHICATWDGTEGVLYVNSVDTAEDPTGDTDVLILDSTTTCRIGANWDGDIDEVTIWQYALSGAEVKDIYEARLAQWEGRSVRFRTRALTQDDVPWDPDTNSVQLRAEATGNPVFDFRLDGLFFAQGEQPPTGVFQDTIITSHADLTDITADDHHGQAHDHSAAADGSSLAPGAFTFPSEATPTNTDEGTAIWDTDGDVLRVGTSGSFVLLGASSLTVEEVDASPSVSSVTTLRFDQTDGFTVTDDGGGQATITLAASGFNLTVAETDSTPSVSNVDTIDFDQADGFTVTDDTGGAVTVGLSLAYAPDSVDYLVGTASGDLSGEIVVGTAPAGELGGTWASPTVATTHSGSAHHTRYADSEAVAAIEATDPLVFDTDFELRDNGVSDTDAVRVFSSLGSLYLQKGDGGGVYIRDADASTIASFLPGGLTMAPSHNINVNSGVLSNPLDPTLGTHVGDRDYNDARYGPIGVDYLVGTASGDLSAEIVVGTTPGGELGGTWASPTVDATHSGSAHHAQSHVLDGGDHTVSGLTAGHVLQALTPTTFGFAAAPSGTPAVSVTSETSFGISAVTGTSTNYARQDHTHGSPTDPVTAHVAAGDPHTGYLLESVISGFATNTIALGTAATAGTGTTTLRADSTIVAFDATVPVTQNYSDVAATGSASVAARRDHVHGMPALGSFNLTIAETDTAPTVSNVDTIDFDQADGFTVTDDTGGAVTIGFNQSQFETAGAVSTHEGAGDPHTGYRLESADHTHQSTGAQAGKLDHGLALNGLTDDDHTQYILVAGTRAFTGSQETQSLTVGTDVTYDIGADGAARYAAGWLRQLNLTTANAAEGDQWLRLRRSNGTAGSPTIVADGETLGLIEWYGYVGNWSNQGARIRGRVDGTPATNDIPSELVFETNGGGALAGTDERWTIRADGTWESLNTSDLNMNGGVLYGPLDPTAGSHVGDRDYNDLRYADIANEHAEVHTVASTGPHAQSGLTAGHVLRASSTTAFDFAALQAGDIPDLSGSYHATSVDHGGIGGLGDDDHTQYLLATGARDLTGDLTMTQATQNDLIFDRTSALVNNVSAAITFRGNGFNLGSIYGQSVTNTPATGDSPGQLVFQTTPDGSSTSVAAWIMQSDGDLIPSTADGDLGQTGNRVNKGWFDTLDSAGDIIIGAQTITATNWLDLTDGGATTLHSHAGGADLSGIDFLVGTASGDLSAEIVVGTTPGGELGGTWGSPTVDTTHAGSAHHTQSHNHSAAGDGNSLSPATLILPSSASPAPTTEGSIIWNSGATNVLTIGNGTTTTTFLPYEGATPSTQAFGDAASVGSADEVARSDHKHAMPADPVTAHVAAGDPHTGYLLESVVSGFGTPALTLGTTNAAGTGTTAIRTGASLALFQATAPTTISVGTSATTAAAGSAAFAARRDHAHGFPALYDVTVPTTIAFGATAAVGAAATAARRDHTHGAMADPTTNLRTVDYLVGTASGELSGEIVVGTAPGGELGGTWASPTVDATHSGSAHHTHSVSTDVEGKTWRTAEFNDNTTSAESSGEHGLWRSSYIYGWWTHDSLNRKHYMGPISTVTRYSSGDWTVSNASTETTGVDHDFTSTINTSRGYATYFDVTTNAGEIRVLYAGVYLVQASLQWLSSGGSTGRLQSTPSINGTTDSEHGHTTPLNAYAYRMDWSYVVTLAANDDVAMTALQNTGSTLDITTLELSVTLIEPK